MPLISNPARYSFPDSTQLSHDAKAYLSSIIKYIPKRLCIPALVQVTPILFSRSHEVAYHYSHFLKELWGSLERNDVVNYLISLQSICQYGFTYREMYEGYSSTSTDHLSVNVDGAICESIIEICLKYTEKELREYLLHLFHWTEEIIDVDQATGGVLEGRSEWLKYCRCKIFFQFICELEKKLQSIFVPLMGIVWVYGSEQIMKYVKFITAGEGEKNSDDKYTSKQSKKRKRKDQDSRDENSQLTTTGSSQLIQSELHETSLWILDAVRLCCIHDNIHFIDQVDPS